MNREALSSQGNKGEDNHDSVPTLTLCDEDAQFLQQAEKVISEAEQALAEVKARQGVRASSPSNAETEKRSAAVAEARRAVSPLMIRRQKRHGRRKMMVQHVTSTVGKPSMIPCKNVINWLMNFVRSFQGKMWLGGANHFSRMLHLEKVKIFLVVERE